LGEEEIMKSLLIACLLLGLVIVVVGQKAPDTPKNKLAAADTANAKTDTMKAADTTRATKEIVKKAAGETYVSPDRGIGPIKEIKLGPVDSALVPQGQTLFKANCVVCHDLDQKKIGPPLRDVTRRRPPEFIMNMILNSAEMEEKDPEVKKLIAQYNAYMSVQALTKDQARALLEYLRSVTVQKK
jgi:mono/diheme cytochrome c family protein